VFFFVNLSHFTPKRTRARGERRETLTNNEEEEIEETETETTLVDFYNANGSNDDPFSFLCFFICCISFKYRYSPRHSYFVTLKLYVFFRNIHQKYCLVLLNLCNTLYFYSSSTFDILHSTFYVFCTYHFILAHPVFFFFWKLLLLLLLSSANSSSSSFSSSTSTWASALVSASTWAWLDFALLDLIIYTTKYT